MAKCNPKYLVTSWKIEVANFSFRNQKEENSFGATTVIFLLTNMIKFKHADYLYTYNWKTMMNISNVGHERSFVQLSNV